MNVIRNLNDWEVSEYEALPHLLSIVNLNRYNDQLLWKLQEKGDFTMKSYNNHFIRNIVMKQMILFKQIRKVNAPLRIFFFWCMGGGTRVYINY